MLQRPCIARARMLRKVVMTGSAKLGGLIHMMLPCPDAVESLELWREYQQEVS